MNEHKSLNPKYYRLLEKGDGKKQKGDLCLWSDRGNVVMTPTTNPEEKIDGLFLRPVTVDEWISYSERKPTREDLKSSGNVLVFTKKGHVYRLESLPDKCPNNYIDVTHWKSITPPQPAKPKSKIVELRKNSGTSFRNLTVNQDGTAQLDCGDIISAESIDAFIEARNSVMDKELHEKD